MSSIVQQEQEPNGDVNTKTAQLVQLLVEIGPDIPEIARRLGQYKESVRYRYKEKILGKGFAVQALFDHERLGLKRVVIHADVADEYRPHANAIFTAMNELCYVVSFSKTIPEGMYQIHASVPEKHMDAFKGLIAKLTEIGLFRSAETLIFDWIRNIPMRAEFYDFNTGRWEFDWMQNNSESYSSAAYAPSTPIEFDYLDLSIVAELAVDANKSLAEIAEKLKVNYKKLEWHYRTHVLTKRLTKGYRINWMGTTYNHKLEKALHRKHRYVIIDVIAKDVSKVERMDLMAKFSKLPFVWAEAAGENYYTQIAVPLDYVTEAFQFIESVTAPVRNKALYRIIDQTNALAFTISYQLYDEHTKQWRFEAEDVLRRFERLAIQTRSGMS